MRTRTAAVFTAVLLTATLAACSSDGDGKDKHGAPVNTAVTEPPGPASAAPAAALGQPFAAAGGLEVTTTVEAIPVFTGPRTSTPDGHVNVASLDNGTVPVRVRIAIANKGAAPFDLSKVFVRDFVGTASGGAGKYTAWTNLPEEKLAGLVAPGATGKGAVEYAVPRQVAAGFRITIAVLGSTGSPLPDVLVTGRLDLPDA